MNVVGSHQRFVSLLDGARLNIDSALKWGLRAVPPDLGSVQGGVNYAATSVKSAMALNAPRAAIDAAKAAYELLATQEKIFYKVDGTSVPSELVKPAEAALIAASSLIVNAQAIAQEPAALSLG